MDEKKKKKEKAREKITHRPISNVILARRSITMLDSIYTRPGKISKNVITRWQTIEKKNKKWTRKRSDTFSALDSVVR